MADTAFSTPEQFFAAGGARDFSNVSVLQPGQTATSGFYKYSNDPTVYQVAPPNTSAPVPSSQLASGGLNLPRASTPATGADLVGGVMGANQPVGQSQTPALDMATSGDYSQDPNYRQASSALQTSEQQLGSTLNAMPSQVDLLHNAEQSTGATTALKSLNELNTQLADATAQFNVASQSAETNGILSGTPAVFYQGEQAAIQRQKAVVVGALAARVAAAQGNYDRAEALAKQTAELQFSDWQNRINNLKDFINLNQDNLSRAEKLAISKMEAQAKQQQAQLDIQKENVQMALSAGIRTQFANRNGEFFNVASGQAYSTPEEFFRAAGVTSFQEAYSRGLVSDLTGQLGLKPGDTQIVTANGRSLLVNKLTGAVIKDLGSAYKTGGGSGDTETTETESATKATQYFGLYKGGDRKVSPQTWQTALNAWLDDGHTTAEFVDRFDSYINKNDPGWKDNYAGV